MELRLELQLLQLQAARLEELQLALPLGAPQPAWGPQLEVVPLQEQELQGLAPLA